MAHLRVRHLAPLLQKSLKFSPLVGVLGHRQVGKTTLASQLADSYVTLDQKDLLSQAMESPDSILALRSSGTMVIDECQLAPPLFPALKEWVRTRKKPGQFLLTGSVRFTSRKAIRESLTGRIINWELLPMTLAESHSKPLPDSIPRLLTAKGLSAPLASSSYWSISAQEQSLRQGGLPGIFAVRDSAIRKQRFETQIETLLERDLRLLVQTTLDYRVLRGFLSILAHKQCLPLEYSEISRLARVSPAAARKLISALESMFVIRVIESRGTRSRPVLFFEDQGEATHLHPEGNSPLDFTRFVFSQIRQQYLYRPELGLGLYQYRNRGGAYVPFVVSGPNAALGIIPALSEAPTEHELASARSLVQSTPGARCVIVHTGKSDRLISSDIRIMPVSCLI